MSRIIVRPPSQLARTVEHPRLLVDAVPNTSLRIPLVGAHGDEVRVMILEKEVKIALTRGGLSYESPFLKPKKAE